MMDEICKNSGRGYVYAKEIDIVLYHASCPDGTGAAWPFWRENKDKNSFKACEVRHGEPYPDVKDNPRLRELGEKELERQRRMWD